MKASIKESSRLPLLALGGAFLLALSAFGSSDAEARDRVTVGLRVGGDRHARRSRGGHGYYETRAERVLVEHGHHRRVRVHGGHYRQVWQPARYENRHVRVWVPRRYDYDHRPRRHHRRRGHKSGFSLSALFHF